MVRFYVSLSCAKPTSLMRSVYRKEAKMFVAKSIPFTGCTSENNTPRSTAKLPGCPDAQDPEGVDRRLIHVYKKVVAPHVSRFHDQSIPEQV